MLRTLIVSLLLVTSILSGCSERDERLDVAISQIRQRLREPSSLEIIQVDRMRSSVSERIAVYAIQYRARNGFGGMSAGGAVIHVMQDNSIMLFNDKINEHSLTFLIETGRSK